MQTLACVGIVAFLWFLFVFSLIWGGDYGGIIGDFRYAFLKHGDNGATFSNTVYMGSGSLLAYAFFQLQFGAITPSLITGAFTDRFRFRAWLVFVVLFTIFIYTPVAHWNWGGGFLQTMPVIDFAGGLVVHTTSGVTGFTCILPQRDPATTPISWRNFWQLPLKNGGLSKRRPTPVPEESTTFHNVPFAVVGAGMLWFGWFGFNGCSALFANGDAALAFSNTHFAACTAGIGWTVLHFLHTGKWSAVAASTGAVAGLVAITPAAGYVPTYGGIIIGFIAAIVCFHACKFRAYLGLDDALDVSGVHGVGGITGTIVTGIFADEDDNGLGAPGALNGYSIRGSKQVGYQIAGAAIVVAFTIIMASILLLVVDNIPGIGPVRASEEEELDADHVVTGEAGYLMNVSELKAKVVSELQLSGLNTEQVSSRAKEGPQPA